MRNGSAIQDAIKGVILSEAEKHHLVAIKSNDLWYAYGSEEAAYYYDKGLEHSSKMVAEVLVKMRDSLVDRLKKEGVRS